MTSRFRQAALLAAAAAKVGNELLIVNSEFNRNTPAVTKPFFVTAMPLSVLEQMGKTAGTGREGEWQ